MKRSPAFLLGSISLALLVSCAARHTPPVTGPAPGPGPIYTRSDRPGEIPAGTAIEVRTAEAIDSNSAADGRTYSAEVARDIVGAGGTVLVPKGSPAQLVVLNVTDAGKVTGEQIEFGLRSITVNGRNYLVESGKTNTQSRGLGKNRRTAEMVGGGAALGTLLGATLGGGKGAAIGALAGAAAGAAAQVITKGSNVQIPTETILTFRTEQPIRLQGLGADPGASSRSGN
jgi:hypothetical protein